jgi:HPt (histidine-containing phosphotransfer) domain-containing protein
MNAYVSKPFGREDLVRVVHELELVEEDPPVGKGNVVGMESCIDDEAIERLRELERKTRPGLLRSIIEKYRISSDKLIQQIHEGLEARDPESVRGAAHALKSSSAQLGAWYLSELAKTLETASGETDQDWLETAGALVDQIDAAFEPVVTALAKLMVEEET